MAKKVEVEGKGKTVGMKSGLGVTATWNKLLLANFERHLTDEALTAEMKKEFPERDYFQPVPRVRSFFNAGKYGFGDPDVKREGADKSVGYKETGEPKRQVAEPKKATKAKKPKRVAPKRAKKGE